MMKYTLLILLLATGFFATAQQTKYNPLIPDNLADPTIVQFGDIFYCYATSDVGDLKSDLSFSGNPVVWKSKDFVNWSFEGISFPGIDWNKNRYWAPGRVLLKDGKYYLYVTVEGMTSVAIADKPDGPFHFANGPDKLTDRITAKDRGSMVTNDIDGCPFMDDDGQAYMFWRRRKAQKMTTDLLKLEGDPITIATHWTGYSEGPFMIKRKGIYYYFYTMGGYADYQYGYAMSKKSPLGPFETPANDVPLYTDLKENIWGPGHGFAFNVNKSDKWIFVYLEYGIGGTSRQIYANSMEFNPDGTIKIIHPNHKGVGPLAKLTLPRSLDLSKATATASSYREDLLVKSRKSTQRKTELFYNLPDTLPTRTQTFKAQNAVDNSNSTEWWAAPGDVEKWWQLDLGKTMKLDRCEIFFAHPTLGHAFIIDKSLDGKNWQTVTEDKERTIRSPHIASKIGKARYLRVRILDGTPGIWEVKVY
jgi:hypothetical protein